MINYRGAAGKSTTTTVKPTSNCLVNIPPLTPDDGSSPVSTVGISLLADGLCAIAGKKALWNAVFCYFHIRESIAALPTIAAWTIPT